MKPQRIQLSRAKGWRMPPNTIKVDRTTKWGNPCVVGVHGTRVDCVKWFVMSIAGMIVLGHKQKPDDTYLADELIIYGKYVRRNIRHLRGKNIACWCKVGTPCHADALLVMANRRGKPPHRFNLDTFMAQYEVTNG